MGLGYWGGLISSAMGSMTPAIAGILGVVVGVCLKWFLDLFTERSRWRREDHVRYHKDRAEAYLALLLAGKYLEKISIRSLSGPNLGDFLPEKREGVQAEWQVDQDEAKEADKALLRVEVFASPKALHCARKYHESLTPTLYISQMRGTIFEMREHKKKRYTSPLRDAEEQFMKAIRQELGVPDRSLLARCWLWLRQDSSS